MLRTPKYGWSVIEIGEWSDRISYLDDAAYMLLETLIRSYETDEIQSVEFDAEGWEWKLVFDGEKVSVITEKDDTEITNLNMSRMEIAKELISDIQRDSHAWANFMYYEEYTEEELIVKENYLLVLCERLTKLIK